MSRRRARAGRTPRRSQASANHGLMPTGSRSALTNAMRRADAKTGTTGRTGSRLSGNCRACRQTVRTPTNETRIQTKLRNGSPGYSWRLAIHTLRQERHAYHARRMLAKSKLVTPDWVQYGQCVFGHLRFVPDMGKSVDSVRRDDLLRLRAACSRS